MATFTPEDLQRIAAADDLHIAPIRPDGVTPGTLAWIWSVVVDDDELYVRAYNGTRSRWYRAAISQHASRIAAAGRSFDVTFVTAAADGDLADAIDAADRAKYDPSPYVAHMIGAGSRRATIRIRPSGSRWTNLCPIYSRGRSLLRPSPPAGGLSDPRPVSEGR